MQRFPVIKPRFPGHRSEQKRLIWVRVRSAWPTCLATQTEPKREERSSAVEPCRNFYTDDSLSWTVIWDGK